MQRSNQINRTLSAFVFRIVGYLILLFSTAAFACILFILYKAIVDPPRNDIDPLRFVDERHHVEPDDELGWRLRRDYSVMVPGKPESTMSHTNDRGARVGEAGLKAPGMVKAMIVGGSQTWGQALTYDQIITAQLEKRLNAKVANYSIPGFGGAGSAIVLKRHLDQHPSWVIYGFWEDHLRRNVISCAPTTADVCLGYPSVRFKEDGSAYIEPPHNATQALLGARSWYRETTTREGGSGNLWTDFYWTGYRLYVKTIRPYFFPKTDAVYNDPKFQWKASRYVLERMNADATGIGAKLIVVWIPLYFSDKMNAFPDDIAADMCGKGAYLIDGTHVVDALRSQGQDVSIVGDGHISPAAHRMFAEKIAEIIKGGPSDCPTP